MSARSDLKKWHDARTLADLGALGTGWLRGRLAAAPFTADPPWPLTGDHADTVELLYFRGFVVTDVQQAGEHQSAAVRGWCSNDTWSRLFMLSQGSWIVVRPRPAPDRIERLREWEKHCPHAIDVLKHSAYCEVIDPRIGSDEGLWAFLAEFCDWTAGKRP